MTDHKFALVIFSDPAYKPGWTERANLPTKKDTLHIGIGTIVKEGDDFVTLALFEELHDKTSDVFHPITLLKSHIYKMYEFTEEAIYEAIKRRSKHVRRCINKDVEDVCK